MAEYGHQHRIRHEERPNQGDEAQVAEAAQRTGAVALQLREKNE